MRSRYFACIIIGIFLIVCIGFTGVYAVWNYFKPALPQENNVSLGMSSFKYGTLYITKVNVDSGAYIEAVSKKTGDVNISADVVLNNDSGSAVTVAVTFYNRTDVSYYYNKTETVSWNNDSIKYTVSGIEQEDEVPSKTYKTVYVTFEYSGNNVSDGSLLSELHFNFVVDKDSIGGIVAQTAVDRFRDILNNKVFDGSYDMLVDAMNNRSGWNKASAVTYIGNVSGSSSQDSQVIETLFGQEFMSMDLDGDGVVEPITMMVKRENIDGNLNTGADYTYTNRNTQYTVSGVEMTLYITSENLDRVSSGRSVVVYMASYTKLEGEQEWTQLIPLTKGTASANNYSGFGSANSFNTDTWKSDNGQTIEELVP